MSLVASPALPTVQLLPQDVRRFSARACYVGERIDVRTLAPRIGPLPVVLPLQNGRGWTVVFRYGAVVFFGVDVSEQLRFLEDLKPNIHTPNEKPENEQLEIQIDNGAAEGINQAGVISLREATLERLQVVAEALAKSVTLEHYEQSVAAVFADVEPLAEELQRTGRGMRRAENLLKQIGGTLMIQHKMVGRVEVPEKPELLWDSAELERLYMMLEDEYELRERHMALERKLALISNTAQTLLELLQAGRSLRVEWYIVILIVVEIMITIYTTFLSPLGP